jgi:hypothetical protein
MRPDFDDIASPATWADRCPNWTWTARGSDESKPEWRFVDVELADPRDHPDERLIAFKFRLHMVGDLQQPLHSADDRGSCGNRQHVVT